MRKYPITTFFLLAILISWAGWIPYAASKAGLLRVKIPSEIIWIAEFGPTLSAICITLWFSGKADLKMLFKRIFMWRVNINWYLFAILIIPALILLSLGIDILLFHTKYDFSLLNNWNDNFIKRTEAFTPSIGIITSLVSIMKSGVITTGIIFLILALTNGGLSEEVGWRGFALIKYQERNYNFIISSLFVSLLWAFWHTGTLFWQTLMTSTLLDGLTFTVSYLFQYLLLVIPLSFIYTFLSDGTKGSILLPIIFHAFYNISISIFATALPNFPMVTLVIVLWIFAFLLTVMVWRKNIINKKDIKIKYASK
jgi:membrane protease YdiL (CAAX protease family)